MNSSIFIPIIAAMVSGSISYFAATVVHKFNKTYKRKEKALTMANEFSNLISKRSFDIEGINKEILENIGLHKKINKLENEEHLDFDYSELTNFFDKEELKKYIEYMKPDNIEFLQILYKTFKDETHIQTCVKSVIERLDENKTLKENLSNKEWEFSIGGEEIKITENDIKQSINSIYLKYNYAAVDNLNKLEWFAMHFTHNIADSDTVYQSLHQLYLKTLISHYINISLKNKTGHEKFYINAIELYNEWNQTKQKFKRKSDKLEAKYKNTYQRINKLK